MPRPPPPGRGAPGARRPMRTSSRPGSPPSARRSSRCSAARSPPPRLLERPNILGRRCRRGPLRGALVRLDSAARQDPAQVICAGDWRSPLEIHFLWLGDFHPSLLTSLLRSLSPSQSLLATADRVHRRIRAVPVVTDRLRHAQEVFASAEVAGGADLEAFLRSSRTSPSRLIGSVEAFFRARCCRRWAPGGSLPRSSVALRALHARPGGAPPLRPLSPSPGS
ncbi:hypothetical protein ZWY2020_021439 [Hordeum vulgare]|nr:hypothetical protein ZWY2020_021439 [Hordeum vulgare]